MDFQDAMAHETDNNDHAQNVQDFEMWNPPAQETWVLPEEDLPLTFDELKARTRQVHVDQVRDMVPFWMKGVEAAEKGEVLRMEDFLEKLAAEDRWGISGVDDPWGPSIGPWPSDHPWGAAVPPVQSDPWGHMADDPWGKVSDWAVEEESTLSAHYDRSLSYGKGNHRRNQTGPSKNHGKGAKGRGNKKANPQDPFVFVEDIARKHSAGAERKRRMHDFFDVCTQYPPQVVK